MYRLRFMIPVLVVTITLMIEVYQTMDRFDDQKEQFLLFSRNALESKMNLLQNVFSDLIPNGEVERAQRRLEYAALDHQIVTMIITDEKHRVLFSNRREWLALPAPGICRYNKSVAESGSSTRQGQFISMPGQIHGYYPVALGASSAELRPQRFGTLYVEYDYSKPLAQAKQMAYRDAARQTAIFIFFAFLLSLLLQLLITRHIERLLKVMKDVTGGNMSARAGLRGKGEIAQLAQAFDGMTEQLARDQEALHEQALELEAEVAERQAAQESLEDQAVILEEEITERQIAQVEIKKLNAELEQRVMERTVKLKETIDELESFSYSVSHDLRAPLRSIDGFSLALLEDYPEKLDEQGKDYLNRVRAASQRMAELIDDMLKLSRVTRGAMKCESVDLSDLARSVADELRKTEPERGVEFIIQDGLTVRGDPQLLRVVLVNLFGNAWKFTSQQEKARIEFGISATDGKKEYFVRDNGAGFDMTYVDKLFIPFQRLHAYSEFSGTGIGLSIVQRIIRRHGGDISAEGALGRGAAIYFTLQ
jgi:signal transduction histidine kinase